MDESNGDLNFVKRKERNVARKESKEKKGKKGHFHINHLPVPKKMNWNASMSIDEH